VTEEQGTSNLPVHEHVLADEVAALNEEIAKCRELIPSMFQAEDLSVMVERLVSEFHATVKEANALAVENSHLLLRLARPADETITESKP
jgi:regulator of replication initiation timing